MTFSPRLIRLRDAPKYLGMDKNRFNREVRPGIPEIPIGIQGIAFDRHDLDAWVDHYKAQCAQRVARDAPLRSKHTAATGRSEEHEKKTFEAAVRAARAASKVR